MQESENPKSPAPRSFRQTPLLTSCRGQGVCEAWLDPLLGDIPPDSRSPLRAAELWAHPVGSAGSPDSRKESREMIPPELFIAEYEVMTFEKSE